MEVHEYMVDMKSEGSPVGLVVYVSANNEDDALALIRKELPEDPDRPSYESALHSGGQIEALSYFYPEYIALTDIMHSDACAECQ